MLQKHEVSIMGKNKKMWSGRFSSDTDPAVDSFNSSISFDSRMFRQDRKSVV